MKKSISSSITITLIFWMIPLGKKAKKIKTKLYRRKKKKKTNEEIHIKFHNYHTQTHAQIDTPV